MPTAEGRFSREEWVKLGLVTASLLLLYFPMLKKLVHDWSVNPDFCQGFLIPPLVGFLVWQRRRELAATPTRPSTWGLPNAVGAVGVLFAGSLGAELFLTRISLVAMLASLVVFFFGWTWLRLLLFPLAMLMLMIPIPQTIFNQLTFPLQLAASRFASSGLSWVGVPVLREGNLILLPNNVTLEVVEACSGIRSLMALLALGVIYGYFFEPRNLVRWLLLAATVPIAVVANGLRITGTGLLTYFLGEEVAEGFFHFFTGWAVFICAMVLLIVLHKLIQLGWRIFYQVGAQWRRGA